LLLGLVGIGITVSLVERFNGVAYLSADKGAAIPPQILPDNVTLSNRGSFERQLRQDLPIGTAKERVEDYLTDLKIKHFFNGRPALIDQNTFYAMVDDIGSWFGFPGTLQIRIHLDGNDKLDSMTFRVDHLAP